MTTYVAAAPDIQVSSLLMMGILGGMNQEEIMPLLEKYQIPTLKPNQWHDLQPFLDLLREISEGDLAGMYNFVAIGMSIAEHIDFPPDVNDLEAALVFLNTVYHGALDKEPMSEGWRIEKVDENHYTACCGSPFPSDLEYGVAYATAKRFCPKGKTFTIRRDVFPGGDWKLHVLLT
ncbi:MAG: hypothetical protein JXA10_11490 [Anaerolineae bacterium]|nr:hypothetical protein [Anaerolineae bacterium]